MRFKQREPSNMKLKRFFSIIALWASLMCAMALPALAQSPLQINFETGKTALPAGAKVSIDAAVASVKDKADAKLGISGFTDKTGDAAANAELAKQRAFAVRDALKAAGVAEDKIVLQKPDQVMSAGSPDEARRVEIKTMMAAAAPAAAVAAPAAVPAAAAPAPVPNKGDVAWMLTCTALVLLMSVPALALFYGGLVRSKNMLSVLMQVFVTFSLITVLWVLYGYSFAFTEGSGATSPFFGGSGRLFFKGMADLVKGEYTTAATFSKGVVLQPIRQRLLRLPAA
jgi:ammonium transporter, Amt family